jgi:hypothetical protein
MLLIVEIKNPSISLGDMGSSEVRRKEMKMGEE